MSMRRFRDVIYPEIFEPFGYTMAQAHQIWVTVSLSDDINELKALVEAHGTDEW